METENKIPHLLINVILSVALASSFIGFFFFTYAKNIERKIVVNNVEYIVEDLTDTVMALLPENIKNLLKIKINDVKLGDMSKEDNDVKESNKKLLLKAGKVLSTLLVVSLLTAFIIAKMYNFDIMDILSKNLVLLSGIALVEFIFLTYIAANFISADPNVVRKKVLEVIKE